MRWKLTVPAFQRCITCIIEVNIRKVMSSLVRHCVILFCVKFNFSFPLQVHFYLRAIFFNHFQNLRCGHVSKRGKILFLIVLKFVLNCSFEMILIFEIQLKMRVVEKLLCKHLPVLYWPVHFHPFLVVCKVCVLSLLNRALKVYLLKSICTVP